MNKNKLTNKEIDKVVKLKDEPEDDAKYIKEMYDLADKNKFKNNIVASGLAIAIASVIMISIIMNITFLRPKTDVAISKAPTKDAISKDTIPKDTVDNSTTKPVEVKPIEIQTKVFEFLDIEANRTSVLQKAVALNKGSQKGVTVYLLSEILRLNTVAIPDSTTSVEKFMKALTSMDWKKDTDYTKLQKGDICFTTDMPEKHGVPSHTYIFMGWVEEGKTDYAFVCDGQVEEFGTILHKRNLSIPTTKLDKFSFFLRK
ncbi:MAG: hypothetical protein H7Y18_03465 [Clostridiaceae bacterium]|nr:hypothetical protein [Clostridiaceae bacterium]